MKTLSNSHGYYHIKIISGVSSTRLIQSNSERAFIITQLQDLLSPRLVINEIPAHKQLASCIDLLSFSIRTGEIHLLVFSIDKKLCRYLAKCLTDRLALYRNEWSSTDAKNPRVLYAKIVVRELDGPHQALAHSVEFHLLHEDWEYDRYSSIGFYLHDRRGDWMRTWRLTRLYENNPNSYRQLVGMRAPLLHR